MNYKEIESLIKSNKTYIANGIDIEFYTEWNMILESKLRKVRNEVYSKLLK